MAEDEPIVISLSSDESDTEFFTAIRSTRPRPPPPRSPSPSEEDLYDEDDDGQRKRRRLLKRPRKVSNDLPDWTRQLPKQSRKKEREKRKDSRARSTVSASRDEPIVILDSDEDPVTSKTIKGKGKEKNESRRRSPSVTPPPELRPEQAQQLRRTVDEWLSARDPFKDLEEQQEEALAQPTHIDLGPPVEIRVRMVADEARKSTASEKAVQHYERPRVVHMGRNDPLQKLADSIADRLQKSVSDLVFVFNGRRIFALSQTPADLDIYDTAELEGYEKPVWQKVSKQKEAERARLFNEQHREPTPPANGPPIEEPTQDANKIRIKLRGLAGELTLSTHLTAKVSTIIRFYCRRHNLDSSRAERMRLMFDGEAFSGDTTLEDLQVEDHDIVDVEG